MNINILSNIFEYANRFQIPLKADSEKNIIIHLSKLSYLYNMKVKEYNNEVNKHFNVINKLCEYFGDENIKVEENFGISEIYVNPGYSRINIKGITTIDLRTDFYYNNNSTNPDFIMVLFDVADKESYNNYLGSMCRSYINIPDLINAINDIPLWREKYYNNPSNEQLNFERILDIQNIWDYKIELMDEIMELWLNSEYYITQEYFELNIQIEYLDKILEELET